MRDVTEPRHTVSGFGADSLWSPTPFFASLSVVRRLALGAALVAIVSSQTGAHIGLLDVGHLRLFELLGVGAAVWAVLIVVLPWDRFPVTGLAVMSVCATLLILATVGLSGGADSPARIYYVVVAVFNALYFPPKVAYGLLGLTAAALVTPALAGGDGADLLLESMITLPVYIVLTVVGVGISSDVRAAERHRLASATTRERLAEADRWADRLEAIQQIGGLLHRFTAVSDFGAALLLQTRRIVPFDAGRFAILSGDAFLDVAHLDSEATRARRPRSGHRVETTVALVHDGNRLGRLVLERGADQPFMAADRRLLSIIAGFAASAMANARMFEQARYDAERDALTGLLNRRAGSANLVEMIVRCGRDNRIFAACMLDLDGFKTCNDRYGHPAGDDVLQEVGRRLLSACRPGDIIARYGGDEFLVLLPDTDEFEATSVCDRLRQAVAGTPVEPAAGIRMTIELSAGIAMFPHDGDSAERLIRKADHALYAAKRASVEQRRVGPLEGRPQDAA